MKAATSALLAAMAAAVSVPMHVAGPGAYRRRGRPSKGWLNMLRHTQMRKPVRHPGQRKTKTMRRANLALAAFPKAAP